MKTLAVGDVLAAKTPDGEAVVLAQVTTPGIATCVQQLTDGRQCGCPIQRPAKGDLHEGVRAHYRTVHPEKGVQ